MVPWQNPPSYVALKGWLLLIKGVDGGCDLSKVQNSCLIEMRLVALLKLQLLRGNWELPGVVG